MKKLLLTLFLICGSGLVLLSKADDAAKSRELVEKANFAVKAFAEDSKMSYLHENLGNAEGVLVIPALIKGAFIVGGSGGSGVLLAKGEGNQWSYPAFYTMGTGSIGFQIGGEVAEIILMVMTKGGMDSLLASSFKLGTDASVAAGPVGVGGKAQAVDILAFSRTKGAFAGVSLEGAVIKVRPEYNSAYYGKEVRTTDVFITKTVSNPHADELRNSLASIVKAQ
ncbi:MAG: lipid-binding SYLF domain-containing protein [Arenicellales bacterium]|nr:lipid-binding SYLF domain-containing protein [Arenicellales bacterium]